LILINIFHISIKEKIVRDQDQFDQNQH
jgi:hypothetical protein